MIDRRTCLRNGIGLAILPFTGISKWLTPKIEKYDSSTLAGLLKKFGNGSISESVAAHKQLTQILKSTVTQRIRQDKSIRWSNPFENDRCLPNVKVEVDVARRHFQNARIDIFSRAIDVLTNTLLKRIYKEQHDNSKHGILSISCHIAGHYYITNTVTCNTYGPYRHNTIVLQATMLHVIQS